MDGPDSGALPDSPQTADASPETGAASDTLVPPEAPKSVPPHDGKDPALISSAGDPSPLTSEPSAGAVPVVEKQEPTISPSPQSSAPTLPEASVAPLPAQAAPASIRPILAARLPNASVGKPYCRSARELFGDQANRVAHIAVTLPVDCGLRFDETNETIHGTPTKAGEFHVSLTFRLAPETADRPALQHDLALTINPDPASLWQNKPSDSAGVFAKADTSQATLSTSQVTAVAASLRGRSHAHEGKYREDDFAMRLVEETGWHVFVVADGAGSAKYSRRGSQLACETALSQLVQWLGPGNELDKALEKLGPAAEDAEGLEKLRRVASNPLMSAAYTAFLAIRKEAENHQATPRDFATTIIAVITRRIEGRWFFASFAVGDGGAGVLIAPGRLQPLTQPDSGVYAGQTVFLTMPEVFRDQEALLRRAQAAFCEDFRFLAVMTDGITDPIFQNDAAFLSVAKWETWEKQLAEAVALDALESAQEEALLQWLTFPSPGNHDDRTLILVAPKKAGTHP